VRTSSTDDTGNRTDSTGCAGIVTAPFHEPCHARRRASFRGGNAGHRAMDFDRAQRQGLPVSDARWRGRASSSRQASPGHCPGARDPAAGAAAQAGHVTRPGSSRTPAAPAVPGPQSRAGPGPDHSTGTPPGSAAVSARCRPRTSGQRHYAGGLGSHRPQAGTMPDPAGDPGTCLRSWRLTITCISAMTDRNGQSVIS
jgi:hypothetical protein